MLNSYQRRAFLALAVFALEPALASNARADRPEEPQTLWEALNKVDRSADKANAPDPDEPTRVPLGAVPGFTLPALDRIANADGSPNSRKKTYSGPFAPITRLWDKFMTATGSNIQMSGGTTLSFRSDSISGGSQATQAYHDQYYLGQGSNGVYTNADLHVDATMFKYFHYSSTISTSPYSVPGQNRVKLDYNTKTTRVQVGDINAGFSGNSLIDFNRYLSGVEVENKWSRQFKTTTLFSRTKAETKTLSTAGNNSAGPYYLFSGQIVDGSAHVRVDNRDMQAGKDYTLDPTTGELRFLNGNVILQSQTIAITYETLGYSLNQGTIYGFRSQWTPRGVNNFGVTYVTQQTPRSLQYQSRKQQFQGQEIALASYSLDVPIDTSKPFTVMVSGIPLVQGTATTGDFFIDSTFPNIIHLRNPVSQAQNVVIEYFPLDTSTNPGNRSVLGVDGHVGLGKWGSVTLETAMSGLTLGGANVNGKAAQFRADLTPFKNLTTHLTVRDVGNAYSSIQSPGFNRNEKSVELAGEYTPFSKLHLNFEVEKAKRPSYSYGTTTTTTNNPYSLISTGSDTYNQYTLGASYDVTRNAKLSLSRNNLGTQYLAGGSSTSTSDNLTLAWGIRSFNVDVGLIRNVSDTSTLSSLLGLTSSSAATPTSYTAHSSTLTKRLGMNWQALKWVNLSGSLSENAIRSSGTAYTTLTNTNASDRQITARFTPPIKGLTLSYSYDLTDTGSGQGGIVSTGTTGTTTTGTTAGTTATTPTTSTGLTGTTSTGVGSTRSLFAPWVRIPTRDSVTSGFGTTSLGAAGGGINYNLGTAGNYSGILGSTYSNLGLTSISGRSSTNRLGMNYAISRALNVNLNYDVSSSVGDYQYNSSRKNAFANVTWNPSERYAFNGSFNIARVAYTGGLGSTRSSQMQFGFTGRPFGNRITTTLSYQSVRTNSALNQASLGSSALTGVASTATSLIAGGTNTDSNLSSIQARLDVPITQRHTLFAEWLSSNSTGYLGDNERDLRFGVDFYLNQFLKFSLGWQTIDRQNKDNTLANLNYHNSSLLAEFGLHF